MNNDYLSIKLDRIREDDILEISVLYGSDRKDIAIEAVGMIYTCNIDCNHSIQDGKILVSSTPDKLRLLESIRKHNMIIDGISMILKDINEG